MMRNRKLIIVTMILLVTACGTIAWANPTYTRPGNGSPYTGEYMFTHDGNDSNQTAHIASHIEQWFLDEKGVVRSITLDEYAKVEEPDLVSGGLTLTYDADNKTGTWTTSVPIEFYTVKNSTEFAFYWLGYSGATSGDWSTQHLLNNGGNQPEISHFSTWNPVVPVPGSITLAALGLTGFATYRRKMG